MHIFLKIAHEMLHVFCGIRNWVKLSSSLKDFEIPFTWWDCECQLNSSVFRAGRRRHPQLNLIALTAAAHLLYTTDLNET